MSRTYVKRTVIVSLFSALIAAGAFIKVPLPPVPITLQTLFVLICGLLLPLKLSLSSLLVYLFLGIVGLPVFTSGGGIAAFTGPTGGYMVGMIPAVIALSFFRKSDRIWSYAAGCVVATLLIYIPGLLWLKHSLNLGWPQTLLSGLVPFIVGDVIKIAVASVTAASLREKAENAVK
jgi:biotin transport system substrate-specific component